MKVTFAIRAQEVHCTGDQSMEPIPSTLGTQPSYVRVAPPSRIVSKVTSEQRNRLNVDTLSDLSYH